jgi:Asp-tRNA(Asn)/Glu-tRNA(Gln) amidotransferase A subunit family amidase
MTTVVPDFVVIFAGNSTDHYIKASPACARAVLETVDALRKAGHDCVEFDFPGGTLYVLSTLRKTKPDDTLQPALPVMCLSV